MRHAKSGPCFDDPTADACKDSSTFYTDADRTTDLTMLCNAMKYMPGCSVQTLCDANAMDTKYCSKWSLLSDICSTTHGEMMQGMGGCANYKKLCIKDSKVTGCDTGIPDLITTKQATKDAYQACKDSTCSKCTIMSEDSIGGECADPLAPIISACNAKPSSSYCANWRKMCAHSDNKDSLSKYDICKSAANVGGKLSYQLSTLLLTVAAVALTAAL
eukprot:Tamp_14829.p2 GENE.Tamp_14829~~Tamp_14829.p2  ORF type:complete len:237 (-),score=45.03 Tamp_14829:886-1536(-)